MYENVVVYLNDAYGWCLLDSTIYMSTLCQIAMISALVNYEVASSPLRSLMRELDLSDYVMGSTVCYIADADTVKL